MVTVSSDSFNRADSIFTLGSTDGAGTADPLAWSAVLGTWGIVGTQAYCASVPGGGIAMAVVNTGSASGSFSVKCATLSGSGAEEAGLVFRESDASNYWVWRGGVSSSQLYKIVAGTPTQVGATQLALFSGDTIGITVTGNSILGYVNGVLKIIASDSFNNTATKHGMRVDQGSSGSCPDRFDDWSASTTVQAVSVNDSALISNSVSTKRLHAVKTPADTDQIFDFPAIELRSPGHTATSKANADLISDSTAKGLHVIKIPTDSVAITDGFSIHSVLTQIPSDSIDLSDSIVIAQTEIHHLTGVAEFGIDMAGNDQEIPDEVISFFLDEMSGVAAVNDVSSHSGSFVGGVQIGQPEVFASGGKKLLSGASIVLDGSTGYVDISSTIPDFTGRTTATIYSYFKVAAVASASTLMEVADTAHTTGSSIDFTTFLSDIAYTNRPLTLDNGDPFDHTEVAGYRNANVSIDGGTGQLVLTATHTSMTDYLAINRTYTSGMVQTGGDIPADLDIAFQYAFGHLEIDFKLAFLGGPTGIAGLKPVFRLTPRNANAFPYPPEIDILQMFGSNTMTSQVHLGAFVGDNNPLFQNSYSRALDPTGGFHTASMDWDASHIEFFLDGTSLGSYVGPDIARVPMFLSINLGVGGATTTAPNPSDFASGGAELRIARILVEQ